MIIHNSEFTCGNQRFITEANYTDSMLTIIHNFFPWKTSFESIQDIRNIGIANGVKHEGLTKFIEDIVSAEILELHKDLEWQLEMLCYSLVSNNRLSEWKM